MLNPQTGNVDKMQKNVIGGREVTLELPYYHDDIALKLVAE